MRNTDNISQKFDEVFSSELLSWVGNFSASPQLKRESNMLIKLFGSSFCEHHLSLSLGLFFTKDCSQIN